MSKKGHIPVRMCIGCRTRRKREEMIRFTRTAEGEAILDGTKKSDARGFYLCPTAACLKMARRKNHPFGGVNFSEKSMFNE